jgi:TLC domain
VSLLSLEMGYLLADTVQLLLLAWLGSKLDKLMVVHHMGLLALVPVYLQYRKGDVYIVCMFLQNLSTPLLHARYFLAKSQTLAGSLVHVLCHYALLATFLACRIVIWPVLFVSHHLHSAKGGPSAKLYCMAAAGVFASLNAAWASSLVRQGASAANASSFRKKHI